MPAPSPLTGILAKIKRAKEHIDDLEIAIRDFRNTEPYRTDSKPDYNTTTIIHYVSHIEDVPERIPLVAGDAIHNLRSALDHLVYQIIRANGKTPDRPEYPIHETFQKYQRAISGAKKGLVAQLGNPAMNIIDSTQPYLGGEDKFWILHELDRIDKHRLLLTAGAAFRKARIDAPPDHPMFTSGVIKDVFLELEPISGFPLVKGQELLTVPAQANYNPEFTFDVAFAEPKIVEGKAVLETVQKLFHLVDGVVPKFSQLL
jgi:hypothetical protein